jgi:hypothetical protein
LGPYPGFANALSICGPDVRFRSFLPSRSKALLGSEVIVTGENELGVPLIWTVFSNGKSARVRRSAVEKA